MSRYLLADRIRIAVSRYDRLKATAHSTKDPDDRDYWFRQVGRQAAEVAE